jgi:hypothetical protein
MTIDPIADEREWFFFFLCGMFTGMLVLLVIQLMMDAIGEGLSAGERWLLIALLGAWAWSGWWAAKKHARKLQT